MKTPIVPCFLFVKLIVLAAFTVPTSAIATAMTPLVMTFEGAPTSTLQDDDYIENGIKMSCIDNHYDMHSFEGNTWPNIDTYPFGNNSIRFELVDGGLFRLESLALWTRQRGGVGSPYAPPGYTGFVDYIFTFSDGSTLIPEPIDQWQVLDDFFSELPHLTYFIYTIHAPDELTSSQFSSWIDDITLTPVPEPSPIALYGLGCIALLFRRPEAIHFTPEPAEGLHHGIASRGRQAEKLT